MTTLKNLSLHFYCKYYKMNNNYSSSKLTPSFCFYAINCLFRVFIYLTLFELIFLLVPFSNVLIYSNLLSISSAKVFQGNNLILHKVFTITRSLQQVQPFSNSYARAEGTNASTELLYQVTSALNHYHLESAILIGSHQHEHLLKMDSTDYFSWYSKTSWLPNERTPSLTLVFLNL